MSVELRGLKATDAVIPHQKWRVTLVVDPLEPFLVARFESLLERWQEGINTRGLAFVVSPFTREGGFGAKLVAVVDIRIMPLATRDQGTVQQLVAALDDTITGLDLKTVRIAPDTESSAAGEAARNAILAGTDEKTALGSAAENVGGAIGGTASAVQDVMLKVFGPAKDVLILATGILIVYFVVGRKKAAA